MVPGRGPFVLPRPLNIAAFYAQEVASLKEPESARVPKKLNPIPALAASPAPPPAAVAPFGPNTEAVPAAAHWAWSRIFAAVGSGNAFYCRPGVSD